ncbi:MULTISPECIES: RCC1 domain-containing protein [unclassified Nocardioides]|uniref:RCC1 domain-containing protein n=1 Tax=unclassified Nocardioides TaxID=2615069 RepID=UPI00070138E2|nr:MULTISPECIES: Ig-like domain-containing protein [unclassified Nocardioides]KRA31045.1 hypothetical protein ASD81_16255 [Nocardioides sp. Root614]KRA87665.1 hypothetical protein ASD84_16525 [Nocardioides sp. Root682]
MQSNSATAGAGPRSGPSLRRSTGDRTHRALLGFLLTVLFVALLGTFGTALAGTATAAVPSVESGLRLSEAGRIATGDAHSCALNAGEVRCWGEGDDGRLGYGNTRDVGADRTLEDLPPVNLDGNATAIAAGAKHTCALMEGGSVLCWGSGSEGQLGYGNVENVGDDETPGSQIAVSTGRNVRSIEAGGNTTCAVFDNGSVRCWGSSEFGQLGQGNTQSIGDNESPSAVPTLALDGEVTSVAVGTHHACAVFATGRIRCWGRGANGRLGYGGTTSGNIGDNEGPAPSSLPGGAPISGRAIAISAGAGHTCVLMEGGSVACWGTGADGRLGYGNTKDVGDDERISDVGFVALGRNAVSISAGGAQTCALLDNGAVRCWGASGGRLGLGNLRAVGDDELPTAVPVLRLGGDASSLSVGDAHSCARLANGDIRCWGLGGSGRLGNASTATVGDDEHPADLDGVRLRVLQAAASIVAGGSHTCVLLDDGTVSCWGRGADGQLGYGNTNDVGDNEDPWRAGRVELGASARALAAGEQHTCALLTDGSVRCWGRGANGRLGSGNTSNIGDDETPASLPAVNLGGPAVAITAGGMHTCAILGSGAVRCWGLNDVGQLGIGSTATIGDNEAPAAAPDARIGLRARSISAGARHTCAILAQGEVRCWGSGANGRTGYASTANIGDNENPSTKEPVRLGAGRQAARITSGGEHTCAQLDNATVRCWGKGFGGRLGYGNSDDIGNNEHPDAVGVVPLGASASAVIAGGTHTCAILDDGNVRCWGISNVGQLGTGSTESVGDNEKANARGLAGLGSRATMITAGKDHSCVLTANGRVRCWGRGAEGRLGYNGVDNIGDNESPSAKDPVVLFDPDVPPVAVDDVATVAQDSSDTLIDVLANDANADGGPKVVSAVTQPAHGTATIAAGGTSVTYRPDAGYCNEPGDAADEFPYTLNGGSTATVKVTVTCRLIEDQPPAAVDDVLTVGQDSAATVVNVVANDTDADGDPISVIAVTQAQRGVVSLSGSTKVTYRPDDGYCNSPDGTPDTFFYTLNGGATAKVTVTVTCAGGPGDPGTDPGAGTGNPLQDLLTGLGGTLTGLSGSLTDLLGGLSGR